MTGSPVPVVPPRVVDVWIEPLHLSGVGALDVLDIAMVGRRAGPADRLLVVSECSWTTTPSPSRQPQEAANGKSSHGTLPAAEVVPFSPQQQAVTANFSPGGSAPFVFGASPQ